MVCQVEVEKTVSFECELLVARKGSLKVRVNLQAGTMSWQVSRQWCNNFIRTLSESDIQTLDDLIHHPGLSKVDVAMPAETAVRSGVQSLMLTLISGSGMHKIYFLNQESGFWQTLAHQIEKISRTPFQI